MFGTNGHCDLILCSLELQSSLPLRLLDITHETRKDLFSNKYNSCCLRLILSTFPKDRQCADNWSVLIRHVGWPFALSYLSWPLHRCVCLYCNLFHYSDWLSVIASLFSLLLYISVCPIWDGQNWSDKVVCSVTSVPRVALALLLQFLITSWNKTSIAIRTIWSHSSYSVTASSSSSFAHQH